MKPVKATYSVLARQVDDFETLRQHLRFRALEKLVIRKLVRPFNDLMRAHTDYAVDAHHMIAEEVLTGVQVNVDGFVHGGEVTILGFIDEVIHPRQTRAKVIAALAALETKRDRNPPKKHGNMPL